MGNTHTHTQVETRGDNEKRPRAVITGEARVREHEEIKYEYRNPW